MALCPFEREKLLTRQWGLATCFPLLNGVQKMGYRFLVDVAGNPLFQNPQNGGAKVRVGLHLGKHCAADDDFAAGVLFAVNGFLLRLELGRSVFQSRRAGF
jgi:hypothetical protein